MNIKTIIVNGAGIAVAGGSEKLITDARSALDFMASVQYETGCGRIAVSKAAIAEDFFILSTGLAGEVLQKFVNYRCKLAIFGDFSRYRSKPLRDFIFESNKGRDIFFVADEDEAVERLSRA